jgi:hypothetical protein
MTDQSGMTDHVLFRKPKASSHETHHRLVKKHQFMESKKKKNFTVLVK